VNQKYVEKVIELDYAGKRSKRNFFSWEKRLRIAVDAASGKKEE